MMPLAELRPKALQARGLTLPGRRWSPYISNAVSVHRSWRSSVFLWPAEGGFLVRLSPFRMLCCVGLLAIFSSTMAKSPVLPLFAQFLGASEGAIGFIAAASTVIGIVVSLPAGVLSDFWGRRRVILLAMGVFASAPFLYLAVTGVWVFVGVRIYHGLATAIFGPVALALVADLFSKERGEKMGWYSSATLVGRSVAPFVGGGILSLFAVGGEIGFGSVYAVYAICGVGGVLALLLSLGLPVRPSEGTGEGASAPGEEWQAMVRGLREVLSHPGILFTSATEAAQYFAYGAVETFLPLYALKVGLSPYQIGLLLGLKVVVITLTKPLMGRLSDRYGRRGQIVVGVLLGALGLMLVPLAGGFWTLLPISLAFGLSMSTVTASTAALVSDLAKSGSYGAALGTMGTIMDVGHASGPVVCGLLIEAYGYGIAFPVVGVGLAIVSVLFPLVVRSAESPDSGH